MMFCQNCGTKKETTEDRFCKRCGYNLISTSVEVDNFESYTTQNINKSKKLVSESIDVLKTKMLGNLPLILLSIVSFILISSIETIQNIPYIYVIFKILQCIVISLITMKILLTGEEFKEGISYNKKNIIIWIGTFFVTCILVEVIDGILTTIGNTMLSNVSYYKQGQFINNFNLFMLLVEGLVVDIIVTIVTYILVFKSMHLVKLNTEVSIREAIENLKNNINSIIILLLIIEIASFFTGFFLGTKGLVYELISVSIVVIWIAVTATMPYLEVENRMQ